MCNLITYDYPHVLHFSSCGSPWSPRELCQPGRREDWHVQQARWPRGRCRQGQEGKYPPPPPFNTITSLWGSKAELLSFCTISKSCHCNQVGALSLNELQWQQVNEKNMALDKGPVMRITVTSKRARLHLKSPAPRLFAKPFVQVQKHQSCASLAFVRGIHRWLVDSSDKRPVTRKMFPFDDVIMGSVFMSSYHAKPNRFLLWSFQYLDWCCKAIPAGRIGETEEVARLVVFLASREANYLNGAVFPIDGSYSNTSYIPKLD